MTTQRTSQAPRQATVSLADIRQTYSQTRLRFTKTRGVQRITREGGIAPDFVTLICLVSEIYRSYGDKLEPVRQFHPSRETPYSQGHTSSVSHTKISRHITSVVSRDDATTTISEGIIIKRPRKSILEQETYALVSFITELRVRTHAPLKEHPNIAQLRGVGWDFEDEEATIPRPLLLEELAPQGALDNFWARWNFIRLKFKSKLDLARNVAEGIRAMHDCGIVHGDIKPENILIFPRKDADNEFVAKLTDFGHSVFEYSHSPSLPAFTPRWCAPELLLNESGPNPMGFRDMKLTDTYSYGLVVLSIMIGRPFHESVEDFMTPKSNGTMLRDAIELVSKEDRKKNDSDLDLATIELLMRRTIRLRPKHRSLDQCIKIMNHYDKINGHEVRISAPDRASREDIIKGLDLNEMDPRNPATAWELSVCYFSGFGVEISFQSASKWLSVASEAGIPAARHYAAILHEAMNIPYQVLPRQYKEHRIAVPVSEHQSKVQVTGPGSEDLGFKSSQESDYESDTECLSKSSTHASTSKKMPNELFDILNLGTLSSLQAYLQDKPEDINSRDFEGNTPLILAARNQKMDVLKFLLEQVDVDAGIPNRSGHTVLNFLPSFDDETIKDLVPKLAQRRADIQREARAMPLSSDDVVLIPEIRCCAILNAILHVTHMRDRGNRQDIDLKSIRVWASSKLLPLHKVPFNSVVIRELDLPDSVFRAMNYGTHYVEALEDTIGFLLSTEEENVEDLAYSMITEAVESNTWEGVRFLLDEGENRRFTKSWWIRGPLDASPFMRSISLGFREIFKLFMERDLTLVQRRQCRFIMERLLPLRARSTSHTIENRSLSREQYNSPEEGVQKWTRCPLSHEEYHHLVTGNIRTHGSARKDLWNVIETQAKLGHSRSVSYLRQAILYGNHEALEEMLRRGWDPNGPLWARLYTPLQYTRHLGYHAFRELFRVSDPDLPQTDWMDRRTHMAVYEAYHGWYTVHSLNEWEFRLKKSRVILRNYGGKVLPVTAIFTARNEALREWSFIAFFLISIVALPLTFTYATERTWTSMSRGQMLGFSYLWSVLSVCLPTFLIWNNQWEIGHRRTWRDGWIPVGLLILTNYILLPILVIRVNWRPFLLCHDAIIDSGANATCNVVTKCTDYSYLLPLAVAGIELVVWALLKVVSIKRITDHYT
ncbi:hypothetical protein EKO27_g8151 [Xylaria grammica]|uniref:Protein kinase domain-containing protein n=1 Tax=Xylaria grammica TaxID=363999 RepID=A0A439CY76_9PEZI|nr:hypothetical protein EKO27_g8151 [Xylaria grammica]